MANSLNAIFSTVVFPLALERFAENLEGVKYIRQDVSGTSVEKNHTIRLEMQIDDFVSQPKVDGSDIVLQDINTNSVDVVVSENEHVSFTLSDRQLSDIKANGLLPDAINAASIALSRKINTDFYELYKDVYQVSGTGTANPYKPSDILNATRRLSEALVNGQKFLALSSTAFYDIANETGNWSQTGNISQDVFINAQLPPMQGASVVFEDQLLNTLKHIAGSATGGAVTVNAPATAGDTSIALDTAGATDTFLKGDLIDISGNQYVITADATAVASVATVSISPALVADIAATEAVSTTGDHEVNLMYTRDFAAFVSRSLATADDEVNAAKPGIIEEVMTNEDGISLRFQGFYDGYKQRWVWTMDVLYKVQLINARYACRMLNS